MYIHVYLPALLCTIENSFHVYDGLVFPYENWWIKMNNYFTYTGIDTKVSHGYALRIFLLAVNLSISEFDISRTLETVWNVYFHLRQKKYLLCADPSKYMYFSCLDQLEKGLHQVCVSHYILMY